MAYQVLISIFFILYGIWYIFTRFIPMKGANETSYSRYPIATGVVQGEVPVFYVDMFRVRKRGIVKLSRRVVKFKDANGNMVLGIDDRVKTSIDMSTGPKLGENEMFYYWEYEGSKTIERDGCINEYTIHFCDENYYEINTKLRLILNIGNIILGGAAIFAGVFILM